MKKVLSLCLTITMLLSCLLGQTALVSAATTADYTNAPYAGVYQVTSDKAVTLTNETGHTVTLAAGANDYFYLIKGNNNITMSDNSASLTFTALAGNGMDYLAEVEHNALPTTPAHVFYGSSVTVPAGGSAEITVNIPTAGMYYLSYQYSKTATNLYYIIETDTGFYGNIQHKANGWCHFSTDSEVEYAYLRAGDNTITVRNNNGAAVTMNDIRISNTTSYTKNLDWNHAHVVAVEIEADPTPTEEPTVTDTITYTAPFAGVYEATSDKAVTLTNETGHTVTLAAGATDYFYLIKGVNTITTTDATASLTFTELENQGIDKVSEVEAGDFKIVQEHVFYSSGTAVPANSSVDITVELTESGMYYLSPQINATATNAKIIIETDTGLYGEPTHDRYGWCHFDIADGTVEYAYLRAGTNTVTLTNPNNFDMYIAQVRFSKTSDYTVGLSWDAVKILVEETEPAPTDAPTPTPALETITYTAPYAGVYEVVSDKAVTLTNETGHTVTLAADATDYFYLIKGVNTIATTDATASLTFTELTDNGMAYLAEVDAGTAPLAADEAIVNIGDAFVSGENYEKGTNASGTYLNLGVNGEVDFTIDAPVSGIYYLQVQLNDNNNYTMYMESDTGFCGTILKYQWGWHFRTQGASSNDLVMVYLREGTNTFTLKNLGADISTLGSFRICNSAELNDAARFPQYADQLDMDSCEVVKPILTATGVTPAAGELAFFGKIAANQLDKEYGVEIGGKKFYGARPGDTVSDGNEGTMTFEFDAWNGTFDIVFTNITEKGTAGEKTYRFFVGDFYTDEATVTVE